MVSRQDGAAAVPRTDQSMVADSLSALYFHRSLVAVSTRFSQHVLNGDRDSFYIN